MPLYEVRLERIFPYTMKVWASSPEEAQYEAYRPGRNHLWRDQSTFLAEDLPLPEEIDGAEADADLVIPPEDDSGGE